MPVLNLSELCLIGLIHYVLIRPQELYHEAGITSYIVSLSDIIKGNQAYSTANGIKTIMELINA